LEITMTFFPGAESFGQADATASQIADVPAEKPVAKKEREKRIQKAAALVLTLADGLLDLEIGESSDLAAAQRVGKALVKLNADVKTAISAIADGKLVGAQPAKTEPKPPRAKPVKITEPAPTEPSAPVNPATEGDPGYGPEDADLEAGIPESAVVVPEPAGLPSEDAFAQQFAGAAPTSAPADVDSGF
jgi:hypothetical protein